MSEPSLAMMDDLPAALRARVNASEAWQHLREQNTTPWVFGADEEPIAILGWAFQWSPEERPITCMVTAGIARQLQSAPRALCPRRFELAIAYRQPGPTPLALSEFHSIATWMARAIGDGSTFGYGDTIAPLAFRHTQCALLAPPVPELFVSGVAPRLEPHLKVGEWSTASKLVHGDPAFVQLVPLHEDEHSHLRLTSDGLGFWTHALLASDDELAAGMDAQAHVLDLDRPSHLARMLRS